MRSKLEAKGLQVLSAEAEWRPLKSVLVSPEVRDLTTRLYERLAELPNVEHVFDNMTSEEEQMATVA